MRFACHFIVFSTVQVSHIKRKIQLRTHIYKKKVAMALKLIRNVCMLCTVQMFLYFVWMNLCVALTKCSTCNTSWENNSRWKHISMLVLFFFACLPSFCLSVWWKIIWKLGTEPNRRKIWRNKILYYTHKNYVNVMSNMWERKWKKKIEWKYVSMSCCQ